MTDFRLDLRRALQVDVVLMGNQVSQLLGADQALDYFDLAAQHGESLAAAFANSTDVAFLVISFTSDWLYPSYHSKEMVKALTAADCDVTYLDIESSWGHDAFLLEVDTMTRLLSSFVGRVMRSF